MIISKLGNTICRENRKWLILRLFREYLPIVNIGKDFKEKTQSRLYLKSKEKYESQKYK